jgi:hypothetical protein
VYKAIHSIQKSCDANQLVEEWSSDMLILNLELGAIKRIEKADPANMDLYTYEISYLSDEKAGVITGQNISHVRSH